MNTEFFRFSLRSAFVLITLLALLLAAVVHLNRPSREEREARESRRVISVVKQFEAAVKRDDIRLVRTMLRSAVAPQSLRTSSKRLLPACIENGQLEMVQLLLEDQEPPPAGLEIAIRSGKPMAARMKMAKLLLELGADATDPALMDFAIINNREDIADLLAQYGATIGPRELAAFNHFAELRRYVIANPGLIHERMLPYYAGDGPTLLGIALEKGHRELSMFLIEAGSPLDVRETLGQTLLHKAVVGGIEELVSLLIAHGLDVNAQDDFGDTPLANAAGQAKIGILARLIECGANVNIQGIRRSTALHHAVFNRRHDVIRLLLAAGADPDIPDVDGVTSRDLAKKLQDEKTIQLFTRDSVRR